MVGGCWRIGWLVEGSSLGWHSKPLEVRKTLHNRCYTSDLFVRNIVLCTQPTPQPTAPSRRRSLSVSLSIPTRCSRVPPSPHIPRSPVSFLLTHTAMAHPPLSAKAARHGGRRTTDYTTHRGSIAQRRLSGLLKMPQILFVIMAPWNPASECHAWCRTAPICTPAAGYCWLKR